ncbi:MAG: hypothetical protein U5L02_08840 [Rheinheimera sp.]|nr:hypothetical protein [Rheinheimera sp.]
MQLSFLPTNPGNTSRIFVRCIDAVLVWSFSKADYYHPYPQGKDIIVWLSPGATRSAAG